MNSNEIEPFDAEGTALARWIKWVNLTPCLAGGFLTVLVAAYEFAFVQNGWSKRPEASGQLGDYIGGLLNPLVAGYGILKHMPANQLRTAAEHELAPLSFGRKWAESHKPTPREELPC